jgi:hypothetical protein
LRVGQTIFRTSAIASRELGELPAGLGEPADHDPRGEADQHHPDPRDERQRREVVEGDESRDEQRRGDDDLDAIQHE